MEPTLLLHVAGGAVGLLTGAVALAATKGGRVHRKVGMWFVIAMVIMALTGAVVAAVTGVETSVVAGLLTAYLVITGLTTFRRPAEGSRWIDTGPMILGLFVGIGAMVLGLESVLQGEMVRDGGMPVPMLFVFGSVALMASFADLRILKPGRIYGAKRIARHLWRMCFALFIASASFFLGQADKIPEAIRIMPVLLTLAFAPLLLLGYWLWRVRMRKTFRYESSVGHNISTLSIPPGSVNNPTP